MSNKLDKKFHSLPKASLNQGKKQEMLYSILNETEEKRWGKTKGFLLSKVGTVAAVLLAIIIFVMPNDRFGTPAFLMEEEIQNIKELEKFDWTIMLPTYAPFEIHEVEYNEFIGGKIKVGSDGEIVHVNADDLEHILAKILYFSEEPER